MRILIVNGYANTPGGTRAFSEFEAVIREAVQLQQQFPSSQFHIERADVNSLDNYLYELNTPFLSEEARKRFDHLDFVFVDGPATMLPWYAKCQKFLILFRMCKRTKKLLFCAGFGMLMLVFLSSTRFHISRVVNGSGNGSSLEQIRGFNPARLLSGDVLLDNATGDIYAYDSGKNALLPIANVGCHNKKAAEEDRLSKQVIVKPYTYVPKPFDHARELVPHALTEAKCRVLKIHVRHWLVQDIGLSEFLVTQDNVWDVHPVNVTQSDNAYTVLAETRRGPALVQLQNAVGSLFHVRAKYPESVRILRNFMNHSLQRLAREEYVHKRLDEVKYAVLPCKVPDQRVTQSRPTTASTAKLNTSVYPAATAQKPGRPMSAYSGFAVSRRNKEPVTVENNATSERPIQLKLGLQSVNTHEAKVLDRPQTAKIGSLKIKGNFDTRHNLKFLKEYFGEVATAAKCEVAASSTERSVKNESFSDFACQFVDEESEFADTQWGAGDIRSMLHPGYTYQDTRRKVVVRPKQSGRPPRRPNNAKSCLNFKSRTLKHPYTGNIQNDGPYKDPSSRQRHDERQARQKWTSSRPFLTTTKSESRLLKLQSAESHYQPAQQEFRVEDRQKWLAGPLK